jgi:hypothetical protein
VEEESEFPRFVEPGRPVTANGVSTKGENASETREKRRRWRIWMRLRVFVRNENLRMMSS